MRMFFFMMGVPLMIMSFFHIGQVLPYVQTASIISNGEEIVLTQENQVALIEEIEQMFENSHMMPAFGVALPEEFENEISSGVYVRLKFASTLEVDELPFDELYFKVEAENIGINFIRLNNSAVQGRCLHVQLQDKNMSKLSEFVSTLIN